MAVEKFVSAYSKPNDGLRSSEEFSLGFQASANSLNGVQVAQRGMVYRSDTFTFAATIASADNTTSGAQGSLQFCTFPEGLIKIDGCVANLAIARVGTALAAGAATVGSIGSAAAGSNNATLTSTEADVIASTACTLTAGAGSFAAVNTASVYLDGTSAAKSLYLNFATPDADSSGNDSFTVTGTITVEYHLVGDK